MTDNELQLVVSLSILGGSIIGGWLGAYIYGRASEKGRLAAVRAAFTEVLKQAEGRAAAEERGKRTATHEDIENVLREVKLVTRETERIKDELSSTSHFQKRAWEERFKLYIALLDWTSSHAKLVQEASRNFTSQDGWSRVAESHLEVDRLTAHIVVFGSDQMREAYAHFSEGEYEPGAFPRHKEWCDAECRRVMKLSAALSVLARFELWGTRSKRLTEEPKS